MPRYLFRYSALPTLLPFRGGRVGSLLPFRGGREGAKQPGGVKNHNYETRLQQDQNIPRCLAGDIRTGKRAAQEYDPGRETALATPSQ